MTAEDRHKLAVRIQTSQPDWPALIAWHEGQMDTLVNELCNIDPSEANYLSRLSWMHGRIKAVKAQIDMETIVSRLAKEPPPKTP